MRVTNQPPAGLGPAYLDVHGEGFYMDSAARSDAHSANLADARGDCGECRVSVSSRVLLPGGVARQ